MSLIENVLQNDDKICFDENVPPTNEADETGSDAQELLPLSLLRKKRGKRKSQKKDEEQNEPEVRLDFTFCDGHSIMLG